MARNTSRPSKIWGKSSNSTRSFPKKKPIPWTHAAAFKNGEWVNKTGKLRHFAGAFKNFHGLGTRPVDISSKYEKLSFIMDDGSKIHVLANENIAETLVSRHTFLIKQQLENNKIQKSDLKQDITEIKELAKKMNLPKLSYEERDRRYRSVMMKKHG